MVSGTALGLRIDGKDLIDDNKIAAIDELMNISVTRVMKPWLMSDFVFNLSSYKKKMIEAFAVASEVTVHVSILIRLNNLFRLCIILIV